MAISAATVHRKWAEHPEPASHIFASQSAGHRGVVGQQSQSAAGAQLVPDAAEAAGEQNADAFQLPPPASSPDGFYCGLVTLSFLFAAPGAPTDQPSEPQAPPGADAGAAGEPVLSNAAASTTGGRRR